MTDNTDTRKTMTLAECPIGLFISSHGGLCLKTEYGNNEGRIDAYIVSSGEFFWGDHPQTIANQRKQLVTPISSHELLAAWASRAPAPDEREDAERAGYLRGLTKAWALCMAREGEDKDEPHGSREEAQSCADAINALIAAAITQYRSAVDGLNRITDREIADREKER